jgi:hypothetical protein
MDWKQFWNRAENLIIAALAAAIIQCVVAFLQYLGAHIPDLLQYLLQTGGGVAAILNKKSLC